MSLQIVPLYLTTHYFRTYVYDIQRAYKQTRCCITGVKHNLTVHHTTAYKDLLLQAFEAAGVEYNKYIANISQEEISLVIDQLIRLHDPKVTELYTITKTMHEKYHNTYQDINLVTWQHFIELQKRYKARSRKQKNINKHRRI